MRTEMKEIDVLAKGEVADPGAFFHHEAPWENPGEPDSAGRMDRVTKLFFQEAAPHRPWKQDRDETEKGRHKGAARERYKFTYSEIIRSVEKRRAFSTAFAPQLARTSGLVSCKTRLAKASSSSTG